ncbi:MAG: preprotein translocase subunit YajC [Bacteriovoracaceae bacterium]
MFTKFISILFLVVASNEVMAQAAAPATAAQPSPFGSFAPLIIIFVIFYFLMIRPQKKRLEQEQKALAQLAKGDEVYTKSGIIGVITGLSDKVATLEVSEGVKIKVLRSHLGGQTKKIFESNESNPKKTDDKNKKLTPA